MCWGCTLNTKIVWSFILTAISIMVTITIAIVWPMATNDLMEQSLQLTEYTKSYKTWIRRPFPLLMEFYMYNWTNAEEFESMPDVKPEYVELGPYVFMENVQRADVKYNADETSVAYNQTKIWTFRPDLSQGKLDDIIVNANPVAATLSYLARGVTNTFVISLMNSMFAQLTTFYVGHPVQEWIFDGFEDGVLDWFQERKEEGSLPEGLGIDIPYKRFSWFYERNKSSIYDGRFEINTGKDDFSKVGTLRTWNGEDTVKGLRGECAKVKGTTGEYWPPPNNKNSDATFFLSDLCRSVSFKREGTIDKHGLTGYKWIGDDSVFDNGDKYLEAECWCSASEEQCPIYPSGIYDASNCKNGAPIFFSYPHFYLADESYMAPISGLYPNKTLHESHLAIEPTTGVTIEVRAKLQINMLIRHDERLTYFKEIPNTFLPMFWFNQRMDIPNKLAEDVKQVLLLTDMGMWIVYGFIALDIILAIITGCFIYVKCKTLSHASTNIKST